MSFFSLLTIKYIVTTVAALCAFNEFELLIKKEVQTKQLATDQFQNLIIIPN